MRMRVVVVLAAVPRARAIIAAAGVLWAVMVVVANGRVLADTFVAVAALAAIPVVAALGARASLGIPVLAADEPVAAVELLAAVTTGAGDVEAAVVAEVPAALIFGHAFVSAAAGVPKQAQERMAGAIPTADFAVRAIGIATALRIGALANLVADRATEAVVIGAALSAEGALFSLTAAMLVVRAPRNVGADVIFALDARAEIRQGADAFTIRAALATWVPSATTANAASIEIDALSAFAFLAAAAGVDTGAAIAYFAGSAGADAGTAIANFAGSAGADALARTVVAR